METTDKLEQIFATQKQLDDLIISKHGINYTKDEWIQKEVLAISAELSEVLCEVNYRWWKVPKEIDDSKLHEEIADVFHFFVSLCIKAGLDADTLFDEYMKKSQENFARQEGKSSKKGYVEE